MGPLLIVGLILGGIWLFGRTALGPQAGEAESLPAPDPIPAGPGQALISPAMSGGSPMMQSQNQLRLNTNMIDPGNAAGLLATSRFTSRQLLPRLGTAASGDILSRLPSSGTLIGSATESLPTGRTPFRRL